MQSQKIARIQLSIYVTVLNDRITKRENRTVVGSGGQGSGYGYKRPV